MSAADSPIWIIGAGVAGLTAALHLTRSGERVHVIDKGRGVGGRLATRRIGDARLDHGAQFFTIRGDEFRSTMDEAIGAGVVEVWCHGFDGEDGHPRYFCPLGMTALAKWLADAVVSSGGLIDTGVRATQISNDGSNLGFVVESGQSVSTNRLIVTSPVPQTLELFASGGLGFDAEQRAALEAITYLPTIGLLVQLDGAPDIAPPGGINNPTATFSFIADNFQKGISGEQAVTFHLNGELSREHWDDDDQELLANLIGLAEPWLGSAVIIEAQLKKWKYATPVTPYPDRCMVIEQPGSTIVLAGDAFGGPKVEGAFNSGLAAAMALQP